MLPLATVMLKLALTSAAERKTMTESPSGMKEYCPLLKASEFVFSFEKYCNRIIDTADLCCVNQQILSVEVVHKNEPSLCQVNKAVSAVQASELCKLQHCEWKTPEM